MKTFGGPRRISAASSSGSSWTLPYPPRTAIERGIVGIGPGRRRRSGPCVCRRRRHRRALEHALVVNRLEAQLTKLGQTGVESVAGKRTGGSDDGHTIAGSERARLRACIRQSAPSRRRPPDVRRGRARVRSARASSGSGLGGERNRSFDARWRASASSTRFSGNVPSSTAWITASRAANWAPVARRTSIPRRIQPRWPARSPRAWSYARADRLHLDIVGHDQALIAKLLA